MRAAAVRQPAAEPGYGWWQQRLRQAVRPEFAGELIRLDVDNPVFARGRCRVDGCERGAWSRLLCPGHYTRWRQQGQPDMVSFAASTGPLLGKPGWDLADTFDLRSLPLPARLEVAYIIQCYHDDRAVRLLPGMVRALVRLFAAARVGSLFDRSLDQWLADERGRGAHRDRVRGILRYGWRHLSDLAGGVDAESEFAADIWRAAVLGIPSRGIGQIRFDGIGQLWLREAAKRWARFRLSTGKALSSVDIDIRSVRWLSRFLAAHHPRVMRAAALTRPILEHFLSWFSTVGLAGHTTNNHLVCLRGFLEACRRHRWLPGLPTSAAIYLDELPRRPQPLPRFIPEFVMAQLENPANLAKLPDETTRNLVVLIMETGLRANDACVLPFNPIIDDSVGWPCLLFHNAKMATEQLVPLSARAAEAIRSQQSHVQDRWPGSPPQRLFPSPYCNPDGHRPFSYATLRQRLVQWQNAIDVRDEAGQPTRVTAHQFRHTLGTRLINTGVPQHVVQKLLGHASPQMTARYASIHDTTVRAAFDDYQRHRVDITGRKLDFDPEALTADAEWVKHNLARVQASLPNGYCGRPPQQDCPHPNACLTCPDFQTTPQFLPLHRRQHDDTLQLIDLAESNGNTRLAANHRQVATNLEKVITALEVIESEADKSCPATSTPSPKPPNDAPATPGAEPKPQSDASTVTATPSASSPSPPQQRYPAASSTATPAFAPKSSDSAPPTRPAPGSPPRSKRPTPRSSGA